MVMIVPFRRAARSCNTNQCKVNIPSLDTMIHVNESILPVLHVCRKGHWSHWEYRHNKSLGSVPFPEGWEVAAFATK